MADPESIGVRQLDAERAIGQVFGAPSLGRSAARMEIHKSESRRIGPGSAIYPGIDEFVHDDELFQDAPPELRSASRLRSAEKPSAAFLTTCDGDSQNTAEPLQQSSHRTNSIRISTVSP